MEPIRRSLNRSIIRDRVQCTLLVVALALLVGCAARQDNIEPVPEPHSSPEAAGLEVAGPTIAPLADGRQGFIITETAQLSDAARRDFDTAVTLLREQSNDEAIQLLQQIVAQAPGVTAPHINLAIALQRIGNTEQAEAQFKAALQLIPGHPVACNQYGLLLRKAGRFKEARQVYEQGLARFAAYYPLHRNLGILCDLYLNDLESALAHYEAYSRAKPGDEQVELWIADIKVRLGRP